MQICSFLWTYYGYPVCSYEGCNVDRMRYKDGYDMAREDEAEVDFVSAIPDSGIGMALGYAQERTSLSARNSQIHTDMAPQFHSEHAGTA